MDNERFLLIRRDQEGFKIINQSGYDVIISTKPIKPKRKITDLFFIADGCWLFYEQDFDLSKIYVSFQEKKDCESSPSPE